MIDKYFKYKHHNLLYSWAEQFGAMRIQGSATDEMIRKEAYGCLGEMLVQIYLTRKGYTFKASKIIDRKPVIEPDVFLKHSTVDVKTCEHYAQKLLVNCKAHHKVEKDVTHYWFVKIQKAGLAQFWIYSREEVDEWPTENLGKGLAYYKSIEETANVL